MLGAQAICGHAAPIEKMDNLIGISVEGRRLGYGTTGRLKGLVYARGRELIRGQRIAEFEGPDFCSDEGREVAELVTMPFFRL